MFRKYRLFFFLFFHGGWVVSGQSFSDDDSFIETAQAKTEALYFDVFLGARGLSVGTKYVLPATFSVQHPFFPSNEWAVGCLHYYGDEYDSIPLLYDISGDMLITEAFDDNPIMVNPELVAGFTISGRKFERIHASPDNGLPETGYYEILYAGTTRVIARREKRRRERIESQRVFHDFLLRERYFVWKDARYYEVKSVKSLLDLLAPNQAVIRRFIRSEQLHFRQDAALVLARVGAHYDSLSNRIE